MILSINFTKMRFRAFLSAGLVLALASASSNERQQYKANTWNKWSNTCSTSKLR